MQIRHVGMLIVLAIVIIACQQNDPEAVVIPTRVNQTEIAATFGIPPDDVVADTQTARAPTETATATITSTPLPDVPTSTPSSTETPPDTVTPTPNPIEGTITRIAELTVLAVTATAPTFTPTITDTPTNTPTITLTPSNTFEAVPVLPDNPDPNVVVFTSNRAGSSDIWLMEISGEPSRPLTSTNSNVFAAACDPRGEILVFDSDRNGDRELYRSEYDGSDLLALTDTSGENFHPVWSPTGEFLAYVSTRTGDANIWVVSRDGENFRQITLDTGDDLFPSWSADGNVLFYSASRDGNFDIFQFNLETSTESQVTFTPDIDERYPVLSPNFQNIAYIAEETPGDPDSSVAYVLDSNGFIRIAANTAGRVEMPYWVDDQRLLVAADLGGENVQVLLADVLSTADPRVLTTLGDENRWPRYCFVDPGFLAALPGVRATPILRATVPSVTPVTPTLTPTLTLTPSITPTPTINFEPVDEDEVPADWLLSRETWTGEEFAFIAPDFLPADTRGFQLDNLLNLSWQTTEGTAVLSIALEPFRGELAATFIGYTLNDLPAFPPLEIAGVETAVAQAILLNSVRSGPYTVTEVEYTDVNLTINFRIPALRPATQNSMHRVETDVPQDGWLISTERWAANELQTLARASGISPGAVAEFTGNQVQYRWNAGGADHILLVDFAADDGDLVVNPVAYTVNGDADTVDDEILFLLRESLLTNSIAPGNFFLSRIEPDLGAFNLVFLVPPVLE